MCLRRRKFGSCNKVQNYRKHIGCENVVLFEINDITELSNNANCENGLIDRVSNQGTAVKINSKLSLGRNARVAP